jgi:HEAT repeat protein
MEKGREMTEPTEITEGTKKKLLFVCSVICVCSVISLFTQAKQPPAPRSLPLYDQCSSLRINPEISVSALQDKDPQKRAEAMGRVAEGCDSRAVEPLIAALKDADVSVRIAAVEALGRLGDRNALEALIEAIDDPDWRIRLALGRSLCSFQIHRASYAVLNSLVNPGDRRITEEGDLRARCQGILEINQLRDVGFSRKAVGFLFRFLDDDREKFRRIAEETMMELKRTRNGPHELIGVLKQNNQPEFRRKAAFWLGKLRIEQSRDVLAEASAKDPDPGVRRVAGEALAEMKSKG